jgi:hypothetical protein
MKLSELSEVYNLISRGSEQLPARKEARLLRQAALKRVSQGKGFTKIAFDTRRIDQETEYNPRRGLQNYNRSEAFLSEATGAKIKQFAKVRRVCEELKRVYGKEPEWQDSNARVLLTTLNHGLRADTHDGDFAENQPGMGSFDYIEELLHVRYRLGFDSIAKMADSDLKRVILSKDEELIRKDVNQSLEITKHDVATQGYDTLMEKLFSGARASSENPDVERTITITIRDRFHKQGD